MTPVVVASVLVPFTTSEDVAVRLLAVMESGSRDVIDEVLTNPLVAVSTPVSVPIRVVPVRVVLAKVAEEVAVREPTVPFPMLRAPKAVIEATTKATRAVRDIL
jgi:hypothetical protein